MNPSSVVSIRGALAPAFVALVLFRLVYAWWGPLELVGDEAYYWDWSRRLAWGYYSKPPMVAWLIAGATSLGGDHVAVIRTLAVLFTSGSLVFAYLLATELFDERVARWFLTTLALVPAALAQNLIFTIDAPLLFFWSAALWGFARWLRARSRRGQNIWGLALALCVGAGLLTKQMMAVFPLLALIYLGSSTTHRNRLREWRIWGIFALGFSAWIPVAVWNIRHSWVLVSHTAHHFEFYPFSVVAAVRRFTAFVGGEVALMGFVVGLLGVAALLTAIARFWRRELNDAERLLFWFSVPALLVMAFLTFRQRINLNWPLVYLPSLLLLTVHWSLPNTQGQRRLKIGRWLRPGLIFSAALSVVAYAYPAIVRGVDLGGSRLDPTARLRGWQELATEVEPWRERMRDEFGEPGFVLTSGHRYVTSQMAFYLAGQPRVLRWPTVPGATESQYEVWGGLDDYQGQPALIIHQLDKHGPELPAALRSAFESIEPRHTVAVSLGGGHVRRYQLFFGHHFLGAAHEG
ncbi:ArnT family glycosyltransferase [Synoicihabitans lomoniglobus]|uniref:Glycosyltransferase family 39 protein n=1 Tax=Synoicihabitans lomoniglobus TaxID=2909285 RepID=A0AAF0CPJ9_9BACT|nr:glycosyltransferase family 39 protein [Opitutaceae bacterium LMO-M01]WED65134.1 glycosyltransferase family 39 protein [Opitutaceae bacterium LMO-M01]